MCQISDLAMLDSKGQGNHPAQVHRRPHGPVSENARSGTRPIATEVPNCPFKLQMVVVNAAYLTALTRLRDSQNVIELQQGRFLTMGEPTTLVSE
jgi:hypothetical protein